MTPPSSTASAHDGANTTDAASRPLGMAQGKLPAQASLVVVASPSAALVDTRHVLDGELWLIGRDVEGHGLRVNDSRMSRLHARLLWDPYIGRYRISDAQSRNGTYIDGVRVSSAVLQPDSVVRVGDTLLVYTESAGHAAEQEADRVAGSTLHVLLRGETGTGKEVLSRRIHQRSGRRGEFVAVNCASLSRELIASELFGHAKGSFSGASTPRKGLFAQAEGGTLLLDEVGDCPAEVQVSLLRVLQEKKIRPVGTERELAVDVRILAATHRDLEQAVQEGSFRADLYARLSQVTLRLSPLRERKAELLGLLRSFARSAGRELELSLDALELLLRWHWPYNVRELESLVHSFLVREGASATLTRAYLQAHHPQLAASAPGERESAEIPTAVGVAQRARIAALLRTHAGNVSEVAREVGKPRAQVYRWMRSMGLTAERFRR